MPDVLEAVGESEVGGLMPKLRILLDPEKEGVGVPYTGRVIHLGNDDEIVITGLPDGVRGEDGEKHPSMAFVFRTPDGDLLVAETTWRLFHTAYQSFLGKFGEPNMAGMEIGMPEEGMALHMVESEKPFVECGQCGWRRDGENTPEAMKALVSELHRHWRKKHPQLPLPPVPEFPGEN